MARYVIGPDVAICLAHDEAVIRDEHQILAPTLLRSQMLSLLYQAVRRGEKTRKDPERQHGKRRAALAAELLAGGIRRPTRGADEGHPGPPLPPQLPAGRALPPPPHSTPPSP